MAYKPPFVLYANQIVIMYRNVLLSLLLLCLIGACVQALSTSSRYAGNYRDYYSNNYDNPYRISRPSSRVIFPSSNENLIPSRYSNSYYYRPNRVVARSPALGGLPWLSRDLAILNAYRRSYGLAPIYNPYIGLGGIYGGIGGIYGGRGLYGRGYGGLGAGLYGLYGNLGILG